MTRKMNSEPSREASNHARRWHVSPQASSLKPHAAPRGFTLVEVLVVVTILGIAAAIGVPMLVKPGSMKIQGAARMVMSDLMIAQSEAVGAADTRRVHFNVMGNGYRLSDGDNATLVLPWAKSGYEVSFTEDSRFDGCRLDSASFGGDSFISFDELGSPTNGGTVELSSDGFRYRINVRSFTGRITVETVP